MELIDKDAVIAEIEKLQDSITSTAIDNRINKEQTEAYRVCVKLRSFIEDTLEAKEVDLNKKIKDYFDSQPIITRSQGVGYRLIPTGEEIAKYFFGLGIKTAQKGE